MAVLNSLCSANQNQNHPKMKNPGKTNHSKVVSILEKIKKSADNPTLTLSAQSADIGSASLSINAPMLEHQKQQSSIGNDYLNNLSQAGNANEDSRYFYLINFFTIIILFFNYLVINCSLAIEDPEDSQNSSIDSNEDLTMSSDSNSSKSN